MMLPLTWASAISIISLAGTQCPLARSTTSLETSNSEANPLLVRKQRVQTTSSTRTQRMLDPLDTLDPQDDQGLR